MVYIKQYRIEGVGHTGAPYTMDMQFTEIQAGNRCYFDPIHGIPMVVAEDLINGWNRTVKIYGNPTVYSIIMPVPEKPVAPQCTSTVKIDIAHTTRDAAYVLLRSGVWSEVEFEEWCLSIAAEAKHDGYNDGISDAKAMIDSLLME